MYFPDKECVHSILTLYVYATALSRRRLDKLTNSSSQRHLAANRNRT